MKDQKIISLIYPLDEFEPNGQSFGNDHTENDVHWGIHLGEDINVPAETEVRCIGKGMVVYSDFHPGSEDKPNWGNIIIVAHNDSRDGKYFFSVYGHLENRLVQKGESVEMGQVIGEIGKSNTPENGWWEKEHLHFAIYVGLWEGSVLPGYWNGENPKTNLGDWVNPKIFIDEFNE